jgi:hypothetical protein
MIALFFNIIKYKIISNLTRLLLENHEKKDKSTISSKFKKIMISGLIK